MACSAIGVMKMCLLTDASSPPNVGHLPFWMKQTLWTIDLFRIKKIYVTVGDINPFIIRAIVHRVSPPAIPLIGTMLAEFSHNPVMVSMYSAAI